MPERRQARVQPGEGTLSFRFPLENEARRKGRLKKKMTLEKSFFEMSVISMDFIFFFFMPAVISARCGSALGEDW